MSDTSLLSSLLSSVPQPLVLVPQLQETRCIAANHGSVEVLDYVPAQPITGGRECFWHQNSSPSYQQLRETQNAYTGQSGGSSRPYRPRGGCVANIGYSQEPADLQKSQTISNSFLTLDLLILACPLKIVRSYS